MCVPHGDTPLLLAVVSGGRSVNASQDVGFAGPLCAALLLALCMQIVTEKMGWGEHAAGIAESPCLLHLCWCVLRVYAAWMLLPCPVVMLCVRHGDDSTRAMWRPEQLRCRVSR